MTTIKSIAVTALTLMIALSPERATAQTRTSAQLADQWREARRAELLEQREKARSDLSTREAVIASELKALDRDSRPDSIAATAPASPASNKTVTTTAVTLTAAPDGSGQKTTNTTSTSTEVLPPKSDKSAQSDPAATASSKPPFGGLDLGTGLSFTLDLGKLNRISRASTVNGIVRSDDQDNGRARIMLESHYFFTPCTWNFLGLKNPCTTKDGWRVANPKEARWGVGPFIAVQPGSDNIIDAIGMGIMVGARREESAQSFNLGIGIVFDPNTRVLGDGILENMPLPIGEIDVRYRETLQTGILVLTSFSF